MSANLENSAVATGLEKVSYHFNPKEGQCQRMFKLHYYCSYFTCKVMLKLHQARLYQYMNQELPDVHAGFRKGKRNQRSNCQHLLDHGKEREFQKNMYFCFIYYAKAFDCVDHNKLENS